VREDMPDVELLKIKVDGGNDPVFIAANVKNVKIFHLIRGVE
jgi:hypothetical protein